MFKTAELLKLKDLEKDDPMDLALGNALENMTELFKGITQFTRNELKSISMLQPDKYLNVLIAYWIDNKKHIKRKYSKEIQTIVKYITTDINKRRLRRSLDNLLNRGV